MASNEYDSPAAYLPTATGVAHLTPRDRNEVDPDKKGDSKTVAKATEIPAVSAVRSAGASQESGKQGATADNKHEYRPSTDPAVLLKAQELSGGPEAKKRAGDGKPQQRSSVASPSEMVGAQEDLNRLDQNRDGRIDQLEVRHALRAESENTTYGALSHYGKSLGFGGSGGEKDEKDKKPADKSDKMFAEEIAKAEKEKLQETASNTAKEGDAEGAAEGGQEGSSQDPRPVRITI